MTVINASESNEWLDVVKEWEIYDCEEDADYSTFITGTVRRKDTVNVNIMYIENIR
ncbi:MAG: hypothetical protein HFG36_11340 [Eubacterium sp.]|nr:hypothetical protein [Eubacterium sp.]